MATGWRRGLHPSTACWGATGCVVCDNLEDGTFAGLRATAQGRLGGWIHVA